MTYSFSIQQEAEYCHQKTAAKLMTTLVKYYICSIALCGAENWTLQKRDQKYLKSFEMWYQRRME